MKYLIIIPTYNEKENIVNLSQEILDQDQQIDILIIDDNSPDGTGELVDKLALENPRIKTCHRNGKLGIGSAYIKGFKYAIENKYDLVFEMDADFSHDPKYLSKLIRKSKDYGLVLGSRWVKGGGVVGWPWFRYAASWGANFITRRMLSLNPKDITTGYRCYRLEVLEKIDLSHIVASGYAFQGELTYRVQKAGFKIGEIPIIFVDRKAGKSKMGGKEIITSAKAVWKLFISRKGVGQIIKFGIIGLTGTLIDFGLLNLLAVGLKINVYLAAAISFTLAATNNYLWNKKWTFKGEAKNKKLHIQYIQYLTIAVIGFFLNLLILRICLPYFGRAFNLNTNMPLVLNLSKIVATLVIMVWNFLGSKKWVFKEA